MLAWTPYAVVALIGTSGYADLLTPFNTMLPALFAKSAACIDPFIYSLNHPKIRQEIMQRLYNVSVFMMNGQCTTNSYHSNKSILNLKNGNKNNAQQHCEDLRSKRHGETNLNHLPAEPQRRCPLKNNKKLNYSPDYNSSDVISKEERKSPSASSTSSLHRNVINIESTEVKTTAIVEHSSQQKRSKSDELLNLRQINASNNYNYGTKCLSHSYQELDKTTVQKPTIHRMLSSN